MKSLLKSIAKDLPNSSENASVAGMKKLLRKTFPKVRAVTIKGVARYQTDSRRKGGGTRETFSTPEEALERARQIASEFEEHGSGSVLPFQLRATVLRCSERLGKFGKSLEDATEFYIRHLEAENPHAVLQRVMRFVRNFVVLPVAVAVTVYALYVAYQPPPFWSTKTASELDRLATIGTYVAGSTGVLLTFATILLVLVTFWSQESNAREERFRSMFFFSARPA